VVSLTPSGFLTKHPIITVGGVIVLELELIIKGGELITVWPVNLCEKD
jgi:hypothetical protein